MMHKHPIQVWGGGGGGGGAVASPFCQDGFRNWDIIAGSPQSATALANSLQLPKQLNYELLHNKIYIIQDKIL